MCAEIKNEEAEYFGANLTGMLQMCIQTVSFQILDTLFEIFRSLLKTTKMNTQNHLQPDNNLFPHPCLS